MNVKQTLTSAAALASALILAGAMAVPAMAQMVNAPIMNNPHTYYGKHHAYTERFDSYLDSHPDVAQQLRNNPRLIDDPHYLKEHPDLREYLHKHPNVAQAYKNHPNRFMHRERRYQHSEQRWNQHHD